MRDVMIPAPAAGKTYVDLLLTFLKYRKPVIKFNKPNEHQINSVIY